MHSSIFSRLVRSTAKVAGMAALRQAFVPQPVVNLSPTELRAYVDGDDAVTGRPFMQELIEGLTKPLDGEAIANATFERSTPRLLESGSEEELHRLFLERGWTDNLPVVLPTEERVAEMLAHTSHAPDEVVGHMRPTAYREAWEYTVEKVAVNAVMAGAHPSYFPVILALAASGVSARPSTTTSMAGIVAVNGPIREEIGMNSGIGAMGPYNHANATIGRAYGLLSQNLQGGSAPGLTYMGSQGNGYGYGSVTFAENEERSPWGPFHVEHGFAPEDSTVSIWVGGWSTTYMTGVREKHWRENVRNLLRGMDPLHPPVLLLDPIAAREFVARGGFEAKADLVQWVYENALLPAGEFWDNQFVQTLLYPQAVLGVEPWASHLRAEPDELIRVFERDKIKVVVVGGESMGTWRMIGGRYHGTFSVDEWR
ncbi:MAG: hypothetical protein GEV03_10890 [Streptosporangiales bacterium]|nr:hypothetical protein [Streptosporangiales bacterium]